MLGLSARASVTVTSQESLDSGPGDLNAGAAAGGSESAAAAGTGSDSDHDDVASYCQCGSGRWLAGCSGNGSARILGSAAGSGRVTPIPQTEYVVRNGAKNSIR